MFLIQHNNQRHLVEPNLENIYARQVQPRGTVRSGGMGGSSFGPVYERDPALRNLENSVFLQINELTKEFNEKAPTSIKQNDVRAVSVEDAIKELLELEKVIT